MAGRSGKFDQINRERTHAPIIQAFPDLVREMLAGSAEELARWTAALSAALGADGARIVGVIPQMERIISPQPAVSELGALEEQRRFIAAVRNFVSAFTADGRPLVLFLDDMQWCDLASLKLLEALAMAPDLGHLLLVCACRNNEGVAARRFRPTEPAFPKGS